MFLLVSTIIAAAISCTSATPVVTAVPIAGGCEAYPNYDNNTQMAFPLLAKVTNSDNPAIEGFFDTDDVSIGVGSRGPILRWGYVRDYSILFSLFQHRLLTQPTAAYFPGQQFRAKGSSSMLQQHFAGVHSIKLQRSILWDNLGKLNSHGSSLSRLHVPSCEGRPNNAICALYQWNQTKRSLSWWLR